MHRIFSGIVSAAVLLASPAHARPGAGLTGVWRGTLGSQPVQACINHREGDNFGAYYYQAHLQAIALQQSNEDSRTFIEGVDRDDAKAPRWTFENSSADALTGHWVQGTRSLPIKLSRVPGLRLKEDETPCGSMLFQAPRLQGMRTIAKPATVQGVRYTRLILDLRGHFGDDINVETFALAGNNPAIQRINAKLREPLTGKRTEWLDCVRQAWNFGPYGASTGETISPRMVTHKWLTVMDESGWDCGGAHPEDASVPRLFDLETGSEVDLHDWLSEKAIERERFKGIAEEAKMLRPAFLSFLLSGWKPADEECGEPVRTEQFWRIELTRTGFTFAPELPHVATPCIEEFKESFAKLGPWLSAEGKKNIATFQAEIAARR